MSGTEEAAVAQPVAQQGEGPAPKATPTRPLLIIRQPSVVARMRAHEFRTHADSSIMPYYPGVGKLRGGAHASMRFTEQKKRIVVSKEVLSRLVCVAEELNKAQAQIELRKILKRHEEAAAVPMLGRSASARALEGAVIRDVLSGVLPPEIAAAELELDELTTARHAQLEAQEAASVAEAASGPTTGKPPAGHNRSGPQVVVPDMLASKAPNQRWGFFKLLQRLAPTTQAGALHRAHFGVGGAAAGQQPGGGTRLTAAAQIFAWKNRLHNKAPHQPFAQMQPHVAPGAAAAGAPAAGSNPASTAAAAAGADGGVEHMGPSRFAQDDDDAMDEGEGPEETWWHIIQRRKKASYYRLLANMVASKRPFLQRTYAARTIQRAWRGFKKHRAHKASGELEVLRQELGRRKAMEAALRKAAEEAWREREMRNRLERKLTCKLSRRGGHAVLGGMADEGPARPHPAGPGWGRATMLRRPEASGWEGGLRGAGGPSRPITPKTAAVSRVATMRRMQPGAGSGHEGEEGEEGKGEKEAHGANNQGAMSSLWSRVNALLGGEWQVAAESSTSSGSTSMQSRHSRLSGGSDGGAESGSSSSSDSIVSSSRDNSPRKTDKAAAAKRPAKKAAGKQPAGSKATAAGTSEADGAAGVSDGKVRARKKATKASEAASSVADANPSEPAKSHKNKKASAAAGGGADGAGNAAAALAMDASMASTKHTRRKKHKLEETAAADGLRGGAVNGHGSDLNIHVSARSGDSPASAVEAADSEVSDASGGESGSGSDGEGAHGHEPAGDDDDDDVSQSAAARRSRRRSKARKAANMQAEGQGQAGKSKKAGKSKGKGRKGCAVSGASLHILSAEEEAQLAAEAEAEVAAMQGGLQPASADAAEAGGADHHDAIAAADDVSGVMSEEQRAQAVKAAIARARERRRIALGLPLPPADAAGEDISSDEEEEDSDDEGSSSYESGSSGYELTSEYETEEESSDDDDDDDGSSTHRRKGRKKKAKKQQADDAQRLLGHHTGQQRSTRKGRGARKNKHAEYVTLTEAEVAALSAESLAEVAQQAAASKQRLQGYHRVRPAAAAAAAAAAVAPPKPSWGGGMYKQRDGFSSYAWMPPKEPAVKSSHANVSREHAAHARALDKHASHGHASHAKAPQQAEASAHGPSVRSKPHEPSAGQPRMEGEISFAAAGLGHLHMSPALLAAQHAHDTSTSAPAWTKGGRHPDDVYTAYGWVRASEGVEGEASNGTASAGAGLLSAEGCSLMACLGMRVSTHAHAGGTEAAVMKILRARAAAAGGHGGMSAGGVEVSPLAAALASPLKVVSLALKSGALLPGLVQRLFPRGAVHMRDAIGQEHARACARARGCGIDHMRVCGVGASGSGSSEGEGDTEDGWSTASDHEGANVNGMSVSGTKSMQHPEAAVMSREHTLPAQDHPGLYGIAGAPVDADADVEGPLPGPEEEAEFDLLYDMTRITAAPPSTPRGHGLHALIDEYMTLTISMPPKCMQLQAGAAAAWRARRMAAGAMLQHADADVGCMPQRSATASEADREGSKEYSNLYGRTLGSSYERVLARRKELAALLAPRIARACTFRGRVGGQGMALATRPCTRQQMAQQRHAARTAPHGNKYRTDDHPTHLRLSLSGLTGTTSQPGEDITARSASTSTPRSTAPSLPGLSPHFMPIRVRTRTLSSHATLSGRNICPGAETHAHSNAAAGKPANNGGGGEPQGTAQGRMLGSAGVRVHMSSGSFPWAGAMLGGVGGSAWSTGVPGGLVPLRQHVRMAQMQRSQTQTRRQRMRHQRALDAATGRVLTDLQHSIQHLQQRLEVLEAQEAAAAAAAAQHAEHPHAAPGEVILQPGHAHAVHVAVGAPKLSLRMRVMGPEAGAAMHMHPTMASAPLAAQGHDPAVNKQAHASKHVGDVAARLNPGIHKAGPTELAHLEHHSGPELSEAAPASGQLHAADSAAGQHGRHARQTAGRSAGQHSLAPGTPITQAAAAARAWAEDPAPACGGLVLHTALHQPGRAQPGDEHMPSHFDVPSNSTSAPQTGQVHGTGRRVQHAGLSDVLAADGQEHPEVTTPGPFTKRTVPGAAPGRPTGLALLPPTTLSGPPDTASMAACLTHVGHPSPKPHGQGKGHGQGQCSVGQLGRSVSPAPRMLGRCLSPAPPALTAAGSSPGPAFIRKGPREDGRLSMSVVPLLSHTTSEGSRQMGVSPAVELCTSPRKYLYGESSALVISPSAAASSATCTTALGPQRSAASVPGGLLLLPSITAHRALQYMNGPPSPGLCSRSQHHQAQRTQPTSPRLASRARSPRPSDPSSLHAQRLRRFSCGPSCMEEVNPDALGGLDGPMGQPLLTQLPGSPGAAVALTLTDTTGGLPCSPSGMGRAGAATLAPMSFARQQQQQQHGSIGSTVLSNGTGQAAAAPHSQVDMLLSWTTALSPSGSANGRSSPAGRPGMHQPQGDSMHSPSSQHAPYTVVNTAGARFTRRPAASMHAGVVVGHGTGAAHAHSSLSATAMLHGVSALSTQTPHQQEHLAARQPPHSSHHMLSLPSGLDLSATHGSGQDPLSQSPAGTLQAGGADAAAHSAAGLASGACIRASDPGQMATHAVNFLSCSAHASISSTGGADNSSSLLADSDKRLHALTGYVPHVSDEPCMSAESPVGVIALNGSGLERGSMDGPLTRGPTPPSAAVVAVSAAGSGPAARRSARYSVA